MPKRYILTEKMRDELLNTFKAAQELSLESLDIVSAEYYEMLVKHLIKLKPVGSKDNQEDTLNINFKSLSSPVNPSIIPKEMSLKEIEMFLKADHSLSAEEKFELYYDEHLRVKAKKKEKSGKSLKSMLKELNIDPAKKN